MEKIKVMNRMEESVTIEVGKAIGFKSDVEQYGLVTGIVKLPYDNDYDVHIENESGFDGGYIGGATKTTMRATDCWNG